MRLPVGLAERPVETRYGFHVVEILTRAGGAPLMAYRLAALRQPQSAWVQSLQVADRMVVIQKRHAKDGVGGKTWQQLLGVGPQQRERCVRPAKLAAIGYMGEYGVATEKLRPARKN